MFEFLLSCEEIEDGEQILIDYGPSDKSLIWGRYHLFNRERMRKWFKNGGIQARLDEYVKPHGVQTKQLSLEELVSQAVNLNRCAARLVYPLNNPAALLDLVFSKTTPLEDWWELFHNQKDHPVMKVWWKNYERETGELYSFLTRLKTFEKQLEPFQDLKNLVDAWVLKNIGHLTVMQLLKGIDDIGTACDKGELNLEKWQDFVTKLDMELPVYDWLKDENATLGRKRRQQDMLEHFRSVPTPLTDLNAILAKMRGEGYDEDSEAVETTRWVIQEITASSASPLK